MALLLLTKKQNLSYLRMQNISMSAELNVTVENILICCSLILMIYFIFAGNTKITPGLYLKMQNINNSAKLDIPNYDGPIIDMTNITVCCLFLQYIYTILYHE